MSDILERLRSNIVAPTLLSDAAKEIESLRQQLEEVTRERDEANAQLQEYKDKCIEMKGYVDAIPRKTMDKVLLIQDSGEDK